MFLRKGCSDNMQQISRTPIPKCVLKKVEKQHYCNHVSAWMCFPVNLRHFLRTFFSRNSSGGGVVKFARIISIALLSIIFLFSLEEVSV